MKAYLNNIYINYILIILVTVFSLHYFINIFDYSLFILNSPWFLEPAENENLVYTKYLLENSLLDIKSLMKDGVLPIYPDLYHQLASALTSDILKNLRFISVVSFTLSSILISIWGFKVSNSILVSLGLPILLFGVGDHAIYFLMARVDAFYFFTGIVALFILFRIYYKTETCEIKNSQKLKLLVVSSIFLSVSLLSKQTALYFLFFSLFMIYYFNSKNEYIKQILIFVIMLVIIITIYVCIINIHVMSYYILGLKLFATSYSMDSLYIHINTIFNNYRYYLLLVLIGFFSIIKNKKLFWFWVIIHILTYLMSVKIFGNGAALNNNFILFTFVSTIFIMYSYKNLIELLGSNIVNLIIVYMIITIVYPSFKSHNFDNEFIIVKDRQQSNGSLENNKIFEYINGNKGPYLTDRTDNLLYYSDNNISYEGSVMNDLMIRIKFIDDEAQLSYIHRLGIESRDDISDKIMKQHYNGIVTGIGESLLSIYPIINEYYKPYINYTVFNGLHKINMVLYIRRTEND